MPPFGHRRKSEPETVQTARAPAPDPASPLTAAERLNALLTEQYEINATLVEYREKRAELLRDDGELDLAAIRATQTEGDELKLRLEQLALRLPGIQRELDQERALAYEAAWQSHRPVLAEAEAELAEAIRTFHEALERANAVHGRAISFGEKLHEFVRPPPLVSYNDWALREFLKTIDRRQHPGTASASAWDVTIDVPLDIPPDRQRFTPRRVSVAEIEAISPLAEPRHVHILHGPVRSAHLNIGFARLHPGERHILNARAAHALVESGCAEYCDVTATVAA